MNDDGYLLDRVIIEVKLESYEQDGDIIMSMNTQINNTSIPFLHLLIKRVGQLNAVCFTINSVYKEKYKRHVENSRNKIVGRSTTNEIFRIRSILQF